MSYVIAIVKPIYLQNEYVFGAGTECMIMLIGINDAALERAPCRGSNKSAPYYSQKPKDLYLQLEDDKSFWQRPANWAVTQGRDRPP